MVLVYINMEYHVRIRILILSVEKIVMSDLETFFWEWFTVMAPEL